MKVAGIIAEYNPFHNGHVHQLQQIREDGCDAIMAVMSGSVVQRGSLAVYDKFMRAKTAVLGGVDLVIELPCAYTLAPAELFAKGAISVLNETKIVTDLYFGSECGDTRSLERAAQIMLDEPPDVSARIKENLRLGKGYKLATLEGYIGTIPAELMNLPNNLLGIEYIKALINSGSNIVPHALLREFANHNDTVPSNNFASGNTIRDLLDKKLDISEFIPPITYSVYEQAKPVKRYLYDAIVMYMLRIKGMKEFNDVFDASPDLVARVLRSIPDSVTVDDIMTKSFSKQFSNARIRRAFLSALLEIDGKLVNSAPQYIRVLGFNDKGRELLRMMGEKCKLPIITKVADFKDRPPMFEAEMRATELSAICRGMKRGLDFTVSPYYISEKRYQVADFPKPPIPPSHKLRAADRKEEQRKQREEEKRKEKERNARERKKRMKKQAEKKRLEESLAKIQAQLEEYSSQLAALDED